MGKYDDKYKNKKDEPADVFISLMLRDIANELAEANRLKILELKWYLKVNGMNEKEANEVSGLEDKV